VQPTTSLGPDQVNVLLLVHSHSGILLNESADQPATREVVRISYTPETIVPPNDAPSEDEPVVEDDDFTLWEDWKDDQIIPPGGNYAISVGLTVNERRDHQKELLCRFSPAPVVIISGELGRGTPVVSSEDSDSEGALLELWNWGEVQAIIGNGFQEVYTGPHWTVPQFPFCEHVPLKGVTPVVPDWKTDADKHMLTLKDKQAAQWEQFRALIADRGNGTLDRLSKGGMRTVHLYHDQEMMLLSRRFLWCGPIH
jgi:hypothetical protein